MWANSSPSATLYRQKSPRLQRAFSLLLPVLFQIFGVSRKTDVCWDTKTAGRSAACRPLLCIIYPSQESVSGILNAPAAKWDRAGRAFDASGRVGEGPGLQ